ncbi:MAG: DUF4433 domain-containing protein [Clostridiales bacterium]|nr:DUF4433 domain-containing protein [Clostridiales bacterium]
MATPPSRGKLLYHITHIDNFPSILKNGLMSRQALLATGNYFTDIANPDILSKRENYRETLSKFVLFHFYPKNPFDGAVCKEYGSENMAIITIWRSDHEQNEFFIIPSHPLDTEEPDIYPYEEGFNLIKWDILDMETGRDYHDPEIRKACMAECVMNYVISPEAFAYVYVKNESAKARIQAMNYSDRVRIEVNQYMFP